MMHEHTIAGQLVARTALHVGVGSGNDVTDGLCRRDAEGRYLIPGTAIGGALRSLAVRLAPRLGSPVCRDLLPADERPQAICPCWVCHLFGHSYFYFLEDDEAADDNRDEEQEALAHASRLSIAHALAHLPEGHTVRIRDGVGIDRPSRTSARAGSVKFDFESLPAGTTFDLRLTLENANSEDEQLLAAILSEWQMGRCWLGGRSSRGLGAFSLQAVRCLRQDLSSPDGLMAFLAADDPSTVAQVNHQWLPERLAKAVDHVRERPAGDAEVAVSFVTLTFDVHIDGPFLTNDTTAALMSGFDHVPYLDLLNAQGAPILPGSALRGVWRAQAERIARTLATHQARRHALDIGSEGEPEHSLTWFAQHCPACNPLASRADDPLANCDQLLRDKAKIEDDQDVGDQHLCLACQLFGSTRRGSRLKVEDAPSISPAGQNKIFDFVAIDRFTGGGRDSAKFDALAAWKPTFRARLHLENPRPWELGWLMLVWRDLQDGLLPVGFGSAKGFGWVQVDHCQIHHGFITGEDCLTPVACLAEMHREGLYQVHTWCLNEPEQAAQWTDLAQSWVDAFCGHVKGFERQALPALQNDSYFKASLMTLYEVEAYQCLLKP